MNEKAELWRSLKFLFFSVSAGIIEIAAFALLNETLGWPYWPCYLIALVLSVLWNFTLNRRYTFRSANNVPVTGINMVLNFVLEFLYDRFFVFGDSLDTNSLAKKEAAQKTEKKTAG